MKTISVTLYEYKELSKKAKQKVLFDLAEINVFFGWWDSTYDDATDIGLKIYSFEVDCHKCALGKFTENCYSVATNILEQHGEHCTTYKTAEKFLEDIQPIAEFNDATGQSEDTIVEMEEQFLKDILSNYADILESECKYILKDENVIATIEANEYLFLEDGTEFKQD